MRKLTYAPQSRRDLKAIARYLSNQSGSRSVGLSFTDRLRKECVRLAALAPLMGRARDDLAEGLRSVSYRNYMIFFRYLGGSNEVLEVVRIIEGHRLMEPQFAPGSSTTEEHPNQ